MSERMFGPYRIEALIGRGETGAVYRAFDTGQRRMVALKLLLPALAADPRYAEQFRREAETAARLREPHVIPIHGYGEIDGRLFIDMRLVEGRDLGALLAAGPLDPQAAVDVISQVGAALDAAHADGLVHRDVKPSNVLCAGAGRPTDFVYLVDFGIARAIEGDDPDAVTAAIGPPDDVTTERVTPERSAPARDDSGADIRALACVLFECLTARRPFAVPDGVGPRAAHRRQPPPVPSSLRDGVPAALDAVVAKGMVEAPQDRYPSASALAAAARAALAPRPSAPVGTPGRTGRPQRSPSRPPRARPAHPVPPARPGQWSDREATALHPVAAAAIVIGRAPECDVTVDDPVVSRRHAELRQVGGSWWIRDLGGWNGTFVNGHRVREARIGPQDVVGIGHALLHLQGGTLVEYTDAGDISFEADDLVVTRSGRRLLDRVGFALPQRSLLAVVGPSGSGKSTLLGALTGQRPADSGEVRYAGRDLYDSYDELRQRIGLVPQDDILHPQLTVRRALRYAAELRFPADTPARERNGRVEEVIAELGLTEQAKQRISTLSGGQRKRTSVALELLTRPSLLFLDEPTSGLDPGLDKSVMQTLRALADDGRTVVVVTHTPAQLELCDRLLVLATGGKLAYFGPPDEALAYFGQPDFADMFLLLDRSRDVDWTARFLASPQHARYGTPPGARPAAGVAPARPAPAAQPRQQSAGRQLAVLARRYLAVIAADRPYALLLLALPLLLSVLAQLLPGEYGLSWDSWQASGFSSGGDIAPLVLLLVLGCAFMGLIGAYRELVKERSIFQREQSIGLSVGAYLGSKLVVLGVLSGVQAVILALVGLAGQLPPDRPLLLGSGTAEVTVAMVATALAAMVVGLLISALIANADRAMPMLVIVLLLQPVLCGLIIPLNGRPPLEQLGYLVPARWGFAMVTATTSYRQSEGVARSSDLDPLWTAEPATWLLDLGAAVLLTVAVAGATWFVLRRRSAVGKPR
jgi:ABC-type multidrug transport system ATPase subunit/ABC-type multidrug transport system permease subunit